MCPIRIETSQTLFPELEDVPAATVKGRGAYYTPEPVAFALVRWAVRNATDRLLDPACGDGRFIAAHLKSVGIEQDAAAAQDAIRRAPWALVHEGDFFAWAASTAERFECAAGNPPFIRYQTFQGETRKRALQLCGAHGVRFTALTSSWAPFLLATAALLKPGGRLAFVVPAEVGHAPYASPLLEYLVGHFAHLQIVAVRRKLFPELSEDCWLLFADGYGGATDAIVLSTLDRFEPMPAPPDGGLRISVEEWRHTWNRRLRPYLMPPKVREHYQALARESGSRRLGEIARVGIGYVTGANDFFHLRPSEAERYRIPRTLLHAAVRNGRALRSARLTPETVARWLADDAPVLLLRLGKTDTLPSAVSRYLDTEAGRAARTTYKCRNRNPWYAVPDVIVPDFFLSYMSGTQPSLVANEARCVCTNSVHALTLKPGTNPEDLHTAWRSPFVASSCEVEGHPLGGGMLKLEPGEAAKVLVPGAQQATAEVLMTVREGLEAMRRWRHHG
jgi:adenine-specific DNA-methyltransferase